MGIPVVHVVWDPNNGPRQMLVMFLGRVILKAITEVM